MAHDVEREAIIFFCRHFVALSILVQLQDGTRHASVCSCFVVEIEGRWFLVTAGHILTEIYEDLPKVKLIECNLFDAWHENAEPTPIPFNLADTEHVEFDEHGIDAGFLVLSENQRQLLQKNCIYAFEEEGWRGDLDQMVGFAVLGLPEQLMQKTERDGALAGMSVQPILLSVKRVPEPPEIKADFPRFYGRHADQLLDKDGVALKTLRGMSGGPILGFHPVGDDFKYHLVAIQSRWWPDLRVIAGPLFAVIAKDLKEHLAEQDAAADPPHVHKSAQDEK